MSCGVVFLSEVRPGAGAGEVDAVSAALDDLGADGWILNPHRALGRTEPSLPRCYWSAPFHRWDVFGVFEAPDADAAHAGVSALGPRGWGALFDSTMWIIGPRDLPPVAGSGPHADALGFLALWDWNDAWHAATSEERRAYDAECDVAFRYDVGLGIDLFGRFRTAAGSGWEQVALWECPDLSTLTEAMGSHEAQRDFVFTTSSHVVGQAIDVDDLRRRIT